MRIALGVEYNGASFSGWQSQPGGLGVQDALERALGAIGGEAVRAHAAGRTDAGVHATLQVVHFDTGAQRPLGAWVRGTNAHLPPSVAVLWAQAVAADFHARLTASGRHYTYLLVNRAVRPGLQAGRIGWYYRPLDLETMREGAQFLIGTHDFSAFRAAECQAKSPVKSLTALRIDHCGDLFRFEFSADAYVQHMIRNILGALVRIGAGAAPASWIGELLATRDRRLGPPTFAADGLYFVGADYAPQWGLPPTRRPLVLSLSDSA